MTASDTTAVWLNGQPHEVEPATTVATLMSEHGVPDRGIAVAVDGTVVPRASWASERLVDGARVEVLTAVQGG